MNGFISTSCLGTSRPLHIPPLRALAVSAGLFLGHMPGTGAAGVTHGAQEFARCDQIQWCQGDTNADPRFVDADCVPQVAVPVVERGYSVPANPPRTLASRLRFTQPAKDDSRSIPRQIAGLVQWAVNGGGK